MKTSEKVRIILLEELVKAQTKNPQYSMRAYARKIGLSQSVVSEILSGKRPITIKGAKKILTGLDKDPTEISQLLTEDFSESDDNYRSLDMDVFHVISDWHYYAILSLTETKDFKSSEKWIAERLGISEKVAVDAVEKLIRLEMLEKDNKTGKLKSTGQQFAAISVLANPALRKANRQNLELATQALESVSIEKRDFTAITLCFDSERMNEARKMIKNFRRQFNRVMESGHKKEVYKLCVQLFPLTKEKLK